MCVSVNRSSHKEYITKDTNLCHPCFKVASLRVPVGAMVRHALRHCTCDTQCRHQQHKRCTRHTVLYFYISLRGGVQQIRFVYCLVASTFTCTRNVHKTTTKINLHNFTW